MNNTTFVVTYNSISTGETIIEFCSSVLSFVELIIFIKSIIKSIILFKSSLTPIINRF